MNSRHLLALTALSGALAAGCERDVSGPRFQRLVASDAAIGAARLGVADATQRLAPSMGGATSANAVAASLTAVSRAIDERNATALASALDELDHVLGQISNRAAAAADADAVRLVTAPARALLAPAQNASSTAP